MLSDEERKAIKRIKIEQDINEFMPRLVFNCEDIKILLNLIEKQSKEIEELRNEVMEKELIIDGMKEDRRIAAEEIQEQYFVSKEEAEQKEKKAYIDGTNIADELCNKKWKDKIKAKIEEWQKEKEFYNKDEDREWGQFNNWDWVDTIINELQSLLEKE